jgi:hypothetical protein
MIPAKTVSQAPKQALAGMIDVPGGELSLNAFGSEPLMLCTIAARLAMDKRLLLATEDS